MALKFSLINKAKQSWLGSFPYKLDIGPLFTDRLKWTHLLWKQLWGKWQRGRAYMEMSSPTETDRLLWKSTSKRGSGLSLRAPPHWDLAPPPLTKFPFPLLWSGLSVWLVLTNRLGQKRLPVLDLGLKRANCFLLWLSGTLIKITVRTPVS